MKVLIVNKFLYPNGGSESYIFGLAQYLTQQNHTVDFFGMTDQRNVVTNDINIGVASVEFKSLSLRKIFYPFKIIYSQEARKKIRKLIMHIKPDIIHLNNFNFQITPSILYEIKKHNIPVVMTLHDYQLVCPNHMMYLEHDMKVCEACKGYKYYSCVKHRCIHNSLIKSVFASFEGWLYHKLRTYEQLIDAFISPTIFLKNKFVEFGENPDRIHVLHNFISLEASLDSSIAKGNYVLYFGRLSAQKGIKTLLEAAKRSPEVSFKIAGDGDLKESITGSNIEYLGFKSGPELKKLISEALFTLYPSEWFENCPMSILESQMYGTPVIGANIGGIPELVEDNVDGLLFEPGNVEELIEKIKLLYNNRSLLASFSKKCLEKIEKFSIKIYYDELMKIYQTALKMHMAN